VRRGLSSYVGGVVVKESTRAYIYRVAEALLAAMAGFGLITGNQAIALVGVVAALFPVGLAIKHTSTTSEED
jgi:hypothetical protein